MYHHSRKREDGIGNSTSTFPARDEVHEALAVMSGRRLSRDGAASIHVHILEVTTSRCTEHLVWEVNFELVTVIFNYLHVSSSLRSQPFHGSQGP